MALTPQLTEVAVIKITRADASTGTFITGNVEDVITPVFFGANPQTVPKSHGHAGFRLLGAEEDAPPTAEVLLACPLVLVGSVVEVLVVLDVVDVLDVVVLVVVVPAGQPVTQNTLCLTSAPWEPSALTVSFTWKPWLGCGSMVPKSSV